MATSRFWVVLLAAGSACQLTAERSMEQGDDPDAAVADDIDAATAVDAAIDPLLTSCNSYEGLICDGFESGSLAGWQTDVSGGSLELVSTPTFLGNSALRAQTLTAGAKAQIFRDHPAQTSGTLYTRFYLYLPSSLITTGLAELTNAGDGSGIHSHFGIDGNTAVILVNDDSAASATPLPRDTWICVEMSIDIAVDGGGELFIDGDSVASRTNLDTMVPGGYDGGFFGLHYTADALGALDIYMDEIAVGTQPIGCLTPPL